MCLCVCVNAHGTYLYSLSLSSLSLALVLFRFAMNQQLVSALRQPRLAEKPFTQPPNIHVNLESKTGWVSEVQIHFGDILNLGTR